MPNCQGNPLNYRVDFPGARLWMPGGITVGNYGAGLPYSVAFALGPRLPGRRGRPVRISKAFGQALPIEGSVAPSPSKTDDAKNVVSRRLPRRVIRCGSPGTTRRARRAMAQSHGNLGNKLTVAVI